MALWFWETEDSSRDSTVTAPCTPGWLWHTTALQRCVRKASEAVSPTDTHEGQRALPAFFLKQKGLILYFGKDSVMFFVFKLDLYKTKYRI